MVHQLFVSGEDPYAGRPAELAERDGGARGAHGVLVLILLPLFPPTEGARRGGRLGLGFGGALINLARPHGCSEPVRCASG